MTTSRGKIGRLDLDAIEERCLRASDSWEADGSCVTILVEHGCGGSLYGPAEPPVYESFVVPGPRASDDAIFIVAAHSDVLALIARVRELERDKMDLCQRWAHAVGTLEGIAAGMKMNRERLPPEAQKFVDGVTRGIDFWRASQP